MAKKERLESLDVFRGLTIAGMVLVNNPGSWGAIYKPLGHAKWDGWTPTDFIFPFFLFIVGVAMTLSLDKKLAAGADKTLIMIQVIRRTILLILLGLILGGFPNLRLTLPFIAMAFGVHYFCEGYSAKLKEGIKGARIPAGAGLLGLGFLWWIIDFGHFSGPVRTFTFSGMFPRSNELDGGGILRIPGVLQRIGLCYFFASLILLYTKTLGRVIWALIFLNLYWILLKYISPPADYVLGAIEGTIRDAPEGAPYPGGLIDWIDSNLFGSHLYRYRPDPEGLLSTIPAIGTVIFGMLAGTWFQVEKSGKEKVMWALLAGNVLIIIGACMDTYFPINKKNWSSSYVVFTAGWASVIFAITYYLNDVLKWRKWSFPFVVFGTNPIYVFFASGILARIMYMIKIPTDEVASGFVEKVKFMVSNPNATEGVDNLKTWIYENVFQAIFYANPEVQTEHLASFAFALTYIIFWFLITWPLYHKKWFLKV